MKPIPRRTLLRGAGATIALPMLEAMLPRLRTDVPTPVRLVYVYAPNGVRVPQWWSAAWQGERGELGELSPTLSALAPWQGSVRVLGGLTQDKGRANGDGPGDHARAASTWLTGVQPLKTDGQVRLGVSADQLAARAIGDATRFRSLELGCDAGRTQGQCDSGYSCAYSGHLSWEGPTTPAAKEIRPRALFDRLFRGGVDAQAHATLRERAQRRGSLLDFVREDARGLERMLAAEDRAKLDEYLTGLRELERRLDLERPDYDERVSDEDRPAAAARELAPHARLLLDVLTLALATDQTRVATMMIANEGSNRSYPELGVRDGHHTLSHHGGDAEKHAALAVIDRHYAEIFAHFVRALAERSEGGGTLLDSAMVVYGAGLADGNRHAHHDLPTLLVGGGAGRLPRGGTYRRWPADTPLNDFHLALLERMDIEAEPFGDATGPLDLA